MSRLSPVLPLFWATPAPGPAPQHCLSLKNMYGTGLRICPNFLISAETIVWCTVLLYSSHLCKDNYLRARTVGSSAFEFSSECSELSV